PASTHSSAPPSPSHTLNPPLPMNRSRLCGQHKKPRKTGLRRPRKSGHPPQAHTAIHLAKQKGQDFTTVGCPDFSFVLVVQRRLRPAFTAAAAYGRSPCLLSFWGRRGRRPDSAGPL